MSELYVVGVDEVGRGPLAGPVSVGAFAVLECDYKERIPDDLKNSKALSAKRREKWVQSFEELRENGKVIFHVSSIDNDIIDYIGIVPAITLAVADALKGLSIDSGSARVLLDGGLKAPDNYLNQETIIRGDEKEAIIAAASIVAKVDRDKKMVELAEKFPEYGFERHKGYGTKEHMESIKRVGQCGIHRKTFIHQ